MTRLREQVEYRVEVGAIKKVEDIKDQWLNLQQRADCSYFKSWGWISLWLRHIAMSLQPELIRVWQGDVLVGIGIFIPWQIKRRGIMRVRAMFLNEAVFSDNDMVIEYNGLLIAKDHESNVYKQTLCFLQKQYPGVDEFHFGAVPSVPDQQILKKASKGVFDYELIEQSVCWQVELTKFEQGLDAYLGCLSKNTRSQIRRSLRLYEAHSKIGLHEADTVEEALVYFDAMKELHTTRWQSKGESGAFANKTWVSFHQSIIRERFATGEIQMLQIKNEHCDIAYLFNYVWQGKVYVLQMGFEYHEDKRFKPGYIAHALAIVYNKSKGRLVYDFMHGESRYKKSLSSTCMKLNWIVLQKPALKFLMERWLVSMVRCLR